MAVNCWARPLATEGFAGVTATETRVGAVTVSAVWPEMAPCVARMVVLPAFRVVARPALLIVATVVSVEDHVAVLVRFWVLPSL